MSQLAPLPRDLPFRIISKTIGRGAYASIKKAVPMDVQEPVFAVKLIHKDYAVKHGRVSAKQILMEVSLHSLIGQHPNIIEWFASGEDNIWRWIAMEYAAGGDLFDKIEADVGVAEDIAHLYFLQLISGVSFMHSKGVAHRDLKPENILMSDNGDLKLADFGMATLFEHKGQRKGSTTMCGSPPYIAPEVLKCGRNDRKSPSASKYAPDQVDIWSCGVVLFVLLVGNTPWEEPTRDNWEFQTYVQTKGRSTDPLWERLPVDVLSLLRGMMSVDTQKRFSFARIRQHPWYSRHNRYLAADGKISDPLNMATQMLENLHIDFSQQPSASQAPTSQGLADYLDASEAGGQGLSATQPEMPINDPLFEFDRQAIQPVGIATAGFSSTQPVSRAYAGAAHTQPTYMHEALTNEPSMSQFSQKPGARPSLTQHARRFRDIVPPHSFTRFFSNVPPQLLVQMLSDALHNLNVPLPASAAAAVNSGHFGEHIATLRIRTSDGRRQSLHGEIVIDKSYDPEGHELLEVRFVKVKGDPLEWRRFFKNVVLTCKDAVFKPDGQGA